MNLKETIDWVNNNDKPVKVKVYPFPTSQKHFYLVSVTREDIICMLDRKHKLSPSLTHCVSSMVYDQGDDNEHLVIGN